MKCVMCQNALTEVEAIYIYDGFSLCEKHLVETRGF